MNNIDVISSGYGHIISDGYTLTFTSTNAASNAIISLSKLVEAMSKDLSKLTNIPAEDIIRDFSEECELDTMTAAYNAVLRKRGLQIFKTPTRIILDEMIKESGNNDN